jgi:hypothetical protein
MTRHSSKDAAGKPGPITEDGSCVIGASCIERQGQRTVGDGQVSLTCSGGQCTCLFERLAPTESWHFQFRATCITVERAHALMLDHCLKDMHLASTDSR